jgi:hypothetical protein
MIKKNQHVVPHKNGWAIKGAGNNKATKITSTQQEAINIARDISKNKKSELIVHNKKGQIRQKDSFGNDNFPPKG